MTGYPEVAVANVDLKCGYGCPTSGDLNMTYAKEEINQILSLKGWNQSIIDVFNLYGVLTIGVSSMNPEKSPDLSEWETKQRTWSESVLSITLEDFKDCQSPADVKETFKQLMKRALTEQLFQAAKEYEDA
jgi:hypothetical protein